MRSMTGFGHAARETGRFRVSVTLRGVNHRFLDLAFRLREELRPSEPAVRELLAGRLVRGRVEVGIELEALGTEPVDVTIDETVVQALAGLADDLAGRGFLASRLAFGDLLRLPGVVKLQTLEPEWTDVDREALLAAVSEACDEMIAAREVEGAKLYALFRERLVALREITAALTTRSLELPAALAAGLRRRVDELLQASGRPEGIDSGRLAQEVALLVDRNDVSEELDRLRSHLEHFTALMDETGGVGKRLDFLSQEIFREFNTVGSKCRDGEMTRRVLDGKALCEQVREQLQNVE